VYQYHNICRNSSSSLRPLCFFDDQYLCFCEEDNDRAECFGYDHKLDQCDRCNHNGRCIRGDLQKNNDFHCLCLECHYGHQCQFDSNLFGFTLDSLLGDSSQPMKIIYTIITFLFVTIGFFNNLCSFVTFKRPTPKKFSVGNLLLIVSFLNPLALLVLFIKFVGITFKISNAWSCKLFSYLLPVLTRSNYWMISWITVGRLLIILFPGSRALKDRQRAIMISVVTMLILFGMHGHEIIHSTIIRDALTGESMCVTNFNTPLSSTYDKVGTLIHYVVPFSVQVVSITFLIVLAARSRLKAVGEQRTFLQTLNKQFQMHKDLYIIPAIIILSALPEAIITFGLVCTELTSMWRHILLVAFLLSYSPQLLGFILYVLPSTSYKAEFGKTSLAKKYFSRFFDKNNNAINYKLKKTHTNLEETIQT
jgi:hypothetical protein